MAQVVIERPVAATVGSMRVEDAFTSGARLYLPRSMASIADGRDAVVVEFSDAAAVVEFADLIAQYVRARPKAKGPKKARRPRAQKPTEQVAGAPVPAAPTAPAVANGAEA
jgi:hypothetical protein